MISSKLFEPYRLGPVTLRNRVIRSAAFENMATHNAPTPELEAYHVSVAEGGVGMTTVAYCAVDRSGVSFDGQLYVHEEIKPAMKHMTDAIHKAGAKVSIQLGHCGNMTHRRTCLCTPMGPSSGFNLYSPTFYRGITKEEIHTIVRHYGEAVDFCRECGFDCVEIHCGHAYLISQFLNPTLNRRKDEYGGSLANRMRFMNEVLDEVMLHAKDDMAVVVKMNMTDGYRAGMSMEEGLEVAKAINAHGVHGIILSAGTVSRTPMLILGGAMPLKTLAHYMDPWRFWWLKLGLAIGGRIVIPTSPYHELYFLDWAKRFKQEIPDAPFIYVGGIQSRKGAETVLNAGFELFQLGHVLIEDPAFVNHMKEADMDYKSACCRSNYCVGRMYTLDMKCHKCVENMPRKLQKEIDKAEQVNASLNHWSK